MRSALLILLTVLLGGSALRAQNPADTIDPDHLNKGLIQSLFMDELNALRAQKKVPILSSDPILQKAAQDQSDYCNKNNLVTHRQSEFPRKYTPKDRVMFYRGNHAVVGENVLMTYLKTTATDPNTQKDYTIWTYRDLAHALFDQWQHSPGHYANMINSAYTRSGLGITLYRNKRVLYAAQVFGCDPYTPSANGGLAYSDTTWGVKETEPGKCRTYGQYDFLASIFSSYLIQVDDTVYQYYQDVNPIKHMLTEPRDGLALDLVYKNQFSCPLDNNLHPSTVFDGYMLAPHYRDEIFRNNKYKNGELLSYLGTIPKEAPRESAGLQVNTILIQNGMMCRYSYPIRVEQDILKDLPIYPQWCEAAGRLNHGVADFDKEFYIPFAKNETRQDTFYFRKLKELISTFDGAITKVEITAYSSIEGTAANNLQLQKARADFIERFVKSNMAQPTPVEKKTLENWPRMMEQCGLDPAKSVLTAYQKDTIRKRINAHMYDNDVRAMLDDQRVARVRIHLHKEYDDNTEVRFMPLIIQDRIYKGDSAQAIIAYSRVIDAYRKGNLSKHFLSAIEIPLERQFAPMVSNYLASIIVQSDIFDYSAFSGSYFRYIDSAERVFPDFKPLRFNMAVYRTHLYFHQQLIDVDQFRKLGRVVDSLTKDEKLEKKLRYQLEFNYYLSGSIFYFHQRQFKDMFASFDHVKQLLPMASLRAQEVYDIGRYFNYFARYTETTKLLETYLEQYPNDEDLIYLYVNTGAIVNFNLNQKIDFYYQQMDKLAAKNRPRLCRWFNENYQLLRYPDFKAKICQQCQLNGGRK